LRNETQQKTTKIFVSHLDKSMKLQELTPFLLALNRAEKTEAIALLAASLAWPGIEKTRGVCGGDARVAGTRIPVWLLVAYRQDDASDPDLLEAYPNLTASDLSNVWVYAENHPEEIAGAIARNESD